MVLYSVLFIVHGLQYHSFCALIKGAGLGCSYRLMRRNPLSDFSHISLHVKQNRKTQIYTHFMPCSVCLCSLCLRCFVHQTPPHLTTLPLWLSVSVFCFLPYPLQLVFFFQVRRDELIVRRTCMCQCGCSSSTTLSSGLTHNNSAEAQPARPQCPLLQESSHTYATQKTPKHELHTIPITVALTELLGCTDS